MRDAQTIFSDAQAITANSASTNVIDLTDANHQIGQSPHSTRVRVQISATFNNLTSLDIALQDSADNSTFADTELKMAGVVLADLTAGTLLMDVPLPATGGTAVAGNGLGSPPPGPSPLRRYIRMYYTVTGTAPSTGAVNAWLEPY